MIDGDTTMRQAMAICRDIGAGQINIIGSNGDGSPLCGVFIVSEPDLVARIRQTCTEWDREQDEKEGA